jgi:hypothetical protein
MNKPYKVARNLFICVAILLSQFSVSAQKAEAAHDTNYYVTYPNTVIARTYLSKKFAPFYLRAPGNTRDLKYKPNTKLNFGIGVTYNNYTLNAAYGFSFLNNNNKDKGKTKGLDLDFHLFPKKLTVDLLGVFHKGYHIDPKGYGAANANIYYYRPDVKIKLLGIAGYRVPNGEKFSYKASFVQNAWQKKSAGSLLFGGEAFYVSFDGDSALVPTQIKNGYPQAGVKKIKIFSVGPGVGYAYTLVIAKHLFVTTSLIANMDITFVTEEGSSKNKKTSIKPAAVYKGAIGYNSDTWSLVANLAGNALLAKGPSSPKDYFLPYGNYRLTLAKKIINKKHKMNS